jgi:prophage maintenance system killer protein
MLSEEESYNVAIELLLYVMKKQLFLDGNKRTAVIFANHYLVSKGMGLIVIPVELVPEFKIHLINYYENKNLDIKEFLYNKCLTRI